MSCIGALFLRRNAFVKYQTISMFYYTIFYSILLIYLFSYFDSFMLLFMV